MKKTLSLIWALVMLIGLLPMMTVIGNAKENENSLTIREATQLVPLSVKIPVTPGLLDPDSNGNVIDSNIYGSVVNYQLKKGHTLSISNTDYVFSVRKFSGGNYSTLLKQATVDSFTASEDMTIGMLIRKPDRSTLTAEELSSIVVYDSQYGMIEVNGYAHRFTVEAENVNGGTQTTRAAIFLPESYATSGTPVRLIIMTNGYNGHLTDSVWNGNTTDDIAVMKHYMDAEYAVLVVDNTTQRTSSSPDWGNPQLISSYWKAYEYVQSYLNVEEMFSIHSRSMGTFAAMRMMREHPELVKCALMCGPVLSLKSRFSTDPAYIAKMFGFDDITGATWEADKVVGYDPYTDVDGDEYDLPPTFWMMSQADAESAHLATIEKINNHGNIVETALYTETDHSGVCRLNIAACREDSLAFLEKHQESTVVHRFYAWEIVTEATCIKTGEKRRYCVNCGHYESKEIPILSSHVFENSETACDICGAVFDLIRTEIAVLPGQLDSSSSGTILDSDIYGSVVDYNLRAGHTLSISDKNYVFSVRILKNGNYSTMLKAATVDSFTAGEDMTVGMLIRKPDRSLITAEELAGIVLYDTCRVEHTHNYESAITPPTCTEQGYTMHTCECGDSYVDTYTDPLGHINEDENTLCDRCGEPLHPDIVTGDLNDDEQVTIRDVIIILHAIAAKNITDFTDSQLIAADVNHDSKINARDAIIILNAIASKTTDQL